MVFKVRVCRFVNHDLLTTALRLSFVHDFSDSTHAQSSELHFVCACFRSTRIIDVLSVCFSQFAYLFYPLL